MIFRSLDENGDWSFGKGVQNYLQNNEAIGLNIKTRVLSWVGDCFFAPAQGIDWVNFLSKKNQLALLSAALRRTIVQSYGVTALLAFDVRLDDERNFTATYTVQTIFSAAYTNLITTGA